jgi:hypothetical protein
MSISLLRIFFFKKSLILQFKKEFEFMFYCLSLIILLNCHISEE